MRVSSSPSFRNVWRTPRGTSQYSPDPSATHSSPFKYANPAGGPGAGAQGLEPAREAHWDRRAGYCRVYRVARHRMADRPEPEHARVSRGVLVAAAVAAVAVVALLALTLATIESQRQIAGDQRALIRKQSEIVDRQARLAEPLLRASLPLVREARGPCPTSDGPAARWAS